MNLLDEVREGIRGRRQGLHFYSNKLNQALGGMHQFYYVIAGAAKSGKTSWVDLNFVIGPYLAGEKFECHYWSNEIIRIEKEAKFATALIYLRSGEIIDSELILGRKMDEFGKPLKLTEAQYKLVKKIYYEDIIPLFGEHDKNGKQIKKGMITVYEDRKSPQEIRNRLWYVAKDNGTINSVEVSTLKNGQHVKVKEFQSYVPNDPKKRVIVVLDHIRGLKGAGRDKKPTMDEMSAYFVDIRRFFQFTIACIVHLNREYMSLEGFKSNKEEFFPNEDATKDSGNLVEDCNYLITMFDPNEPRLGINRHMTHRIADYNGKFRTVHVVRGRNAKTPIHIPQIFHGEAAMFNDLPQNAMYGSQ